MSENQGNTLPIKIKTEDGYSLSDRFYPSPSSKRAFLLFWTMGVSQECYKSFARFLAKNNCSVLTFDFRGMVNSLQELISHVPNAPITWIGHSLDGQVISLSPHHRKVSRFIATFSQVLLNPLFQDSCRVT